MRNILIIIAMAISFAANAKIEVTTSKPAIKQDTIHVDGNCNMCKERIENAALISGVKKATWDKYSHSLIVIYDSTKTSTDKIEQAVAKAGHDTKNYKAPDETYKRLPKCCAYREEDAHVH